MICVISHNSRVLHIEYFCSRADVEFLMFHLLRRGLPSDWRKIPLADDYRDRDERQFLYGLRRRVEGVKERALIGADNPVVRGDVKRGGETGWDEMDGGRGEERTRAAERKREKGGRERESDGNKTWKNKTGRTTLMRATG